MQLTILVFFVAGRLVFIESLRNVLLGWSDDSVNFLSRCILVDARIVGLKKPA